MFIVVTLDISRSPSGPLYFKHLITGFRHPHHSSAQCTRWNVRRTTSHHQNHTSSMTTLVKIVNAHIKHIIYHTRPTRWKVGTTTAFHQNMSSSMMTFVEIVDIHHHDIEYQHPSRNCIMLATFHHRIQTRAQQSHTAHVMKGTNGVSHCEYCLPILGKPPE